VREEGRDYYVLRGRGEMVAGGGERGNEGRYPAQEGDAYIEEARSS
jgi:hypothetical protein